MISRPFLFVNVMARAHRAMPAAAGIAPAVALGLGNVLIDATDVERHGRERMTFDHVRRMTRVAAIEPECKRIVLASARSRAATEKIVQNFPVGSQLIPAALVVPVAMQDHRQDARQSDHEKAGHDDAPICGVSSAQPHR